MQFRLVRSLPVQVELGEDAYVLELVQREAEPECWLRARALREPVVFLLAHFESESEAAFCLRVGFDAGPFPVGHALLRRLVAEGDAEMILPEPDMALALRTEVGSPVLALAG